MNDIPVNLDVEEFAKRFALRVEIAKLTEQRDAARQALRNLVDATSWYGDEKSGHIAVNEGAMDEAMGLVVAWFAEKETR